MDEDKQAAELYEYIGQLLRRENKEICELLDRIERLQAENERLVIEVANRAHFEKHAYIAGLEAAHRVLETVAYAINESPLELLRRITTQVDALIDAKKAGK